MYVWHEWMICALSFFAENFFHTISQQIWFIWEEGSQSKVTVIFYFLFFFIFGQLPRNWLGYPVWAGTAECLWVVQGLPTSFNRKTRNWACLWVSFFLWHLSPGETLCMFFWCSKLIRFVKKKFEELHIQSATPDCSDRVLKIYRTTALDQNLVKETFKLVDQTLRRKNSFETGLLWYQSNETL